MSGRPCASAAAFHHFFFPLARRYFMHHFPHWFQSPALCLLFPIALQHQFYLPFTGKQFLMKCYEWLWSSDCYPALFIIIMGFGCVAGPLLCPAVLTSVSALKAGNAVLGSLSVTIAELPYLQDRNPTHC